jgi:8-oxo-dGTP diphosphatase
MRWQDRHKVIPAVFLIFPEDDKVLLIRRKGSYADGWYGLPAGHADGGESAISAACREAKEEVGVDVEPADLRLVHTMHEQAAGHERINLSFMVDAYHGKLRNMEPQKCDGLRWASPDKLPPKTVPQVRLILEKIAAQESYSDFHFDASSKSQYGPLPPT